MLEALDHALNHSLQLSHTKKITGTKLDFLSFMFCVVRFETHSLTNHSIRKDKFHLKG